MGGVPRSLRFAFQSQTKLYLISDFYNGGELFYYLSNGRFSENRARFYAAEIALGLQYLHSKGIVYRDLKPENIMLDHQKHVKIVDMGMSAVMRERAHQDHGLRAVEGERVGRGAAQPVRDARVLGAGDHPEEGGVVGAA